MPKKITMTTRPQTAVADDWVSGTQAPKSSDTETQGKTSGAGDAGSSSEEAIAVKRLTIDIPEELHARIKSQCALRRTKMADEIRKLLESSFAELS